MATVTVTQMTARITPAEAALISDACAIHLRESLRKAATADYPHLTLSDATAKICRRLLAKIDPIAQGNADTSVPLYGVEFGTVQTALAEHKQAIAQRALATGDRDTINTTMTEVQAIEDLLRDLRNALN